MQTARLIENPAFSIYISEQELATIGEYRIYWYEQGRQMSNMWEFSNTQEKNEAFASALRWAASIVEQYR